MALDGTDRPRPDQLTLSDLIRKIHNELHVPVMADLSCMEDARFAEAPGQISGTTLAGYVEHGRPSIDGPDLAFVSELVQLTRKPVIAEGRFVEPYQVKDAFARGAFAVVIGGAVTRPQEITRRFVALSK